MIERLSSSDCLLHAKRRRTGRRKLLLKEGEKEEKRKDGKRDDSSLLQPLLKEGECKIEGILISPSFLETYRGYIELPEANSSLGH